MLRCALTGVFVFFAQLAFSQGTSPGAAVPAATTEPVAAGKVDLVEGDVRFFDINRRMRRPSVSDPVFAGESIVTGSDGEVHIQMEDGGHIGVRPGTKMRIASYRAEGGAEDRSVIGLLEGSFRSVTGWIATLGPNRAIVRTPTSTIGIRGTEHEPLYIPEGSTLGEPGTYDRVHIGETEIRTGLGSVRVRPNQAGFAPHRGTGRPRVLDRIPGVFRPTRNEARFDGLHERIHAQLNERRDQRRQFIEQRRNQTNQRPPQRAPGTGPREEPRKAEQNQKATQRETQRSQREARIAEQRRVQQERNDQAIAAKAQREARKAEQQKRQRERAEKSRRE
jgi:hypothetical protein